MSAVVTYPEPAKTGAAWAPELELLGVRVSNIDFDDLCALLRRWVDERSVHCVFTPNVDHIVRCDRDAAFRDAYDRASLRIVDGMILMWAARLLGKPVAAKLSGSDMVPRLSEVAAREGYRVFLFGAAPGVADEAAERLRDRYPGLTIAGTYSPPMGFEKDEQENGKAIEAVRSANADLLFVALGSPKQEVWMARHRDALGVPLMMGIGATLDFVSGRVRRAPVWMQNAGLEWVWRLAQEPRRLWRRYLVEDSGFIGMFVREWLRGRSRESGR